MTTLKLDSIGDLAIENGQLVLLSDLVEETAQRIKIKFQFFLGEWELDRRCGMPLYEKVLIKAPKLAEVRRLFRAVLLDDPAVDRLDSLELEHDTATRQLSITFEVTLNDGSSLVFDDFVLAENVGEAA